MISRRLGAVVLVLGSGGIVGCGLIKVGGGGGVGGFGGSGGSTTAATTTATTTTTNQGSSGVTTAAATTTVSTGGGTCIAPSGDSTADCMAACTAMYDCGIEKCNGSSQLCPGFGTTVSRQAWLAQMNCPTYCADYNWIPLVHLDDCQATITNLSASPGFKAACGN